MKHLAVASVLVVLVTVVAVTVLESIDLLPVVASTEGVVADRLFSYQMYVIAFLFALVAVFMVYSAVVFRRRPGDDGDGLYVRGNTTLEVTWTVIPVGVVLYFAVLSTEYLLDVTSAPQDPVVVDVTGAQWSWQFEYPEAAVTSPELVLPLGRPALLRITSTDVIHSFWVPEFRLKQDAVPGLVRDLRITPNRAGEYVVRCAEICGQGHAFMLADAKVVTPEEFETWLMSHGASDDPVVRGKRLAELSGCVACHSADGKRIVGPTWLGLYGKEETMADGTSVTVDDDYLSESIREPGRRLVEGFSDVMPATYKDTLSDDEVADLIAYIRSLEQ